MLVLLTGLSPDLKFNICSTFAVRTSHISLSAFNTGDPMHFHSLRLSRRHSAWSINMRSCRNKYSDLAALVLGISDKRSMRYHGKFQCVVLFKFCRSFVLVLKIRNLNSEFFESFILINSTYIMKLRKNSL